MILEIKRFPNIYRVPASEFFFITSSIIWLLIFQKHRPLVFRKGEMKQKISNTLFHNQFRMCRDGTKRDLCHFSKSYFYELINQEQYSVPDQVRSGLELLGHQSWVWNEADRLTQKSITKHKVCFKNALTKGTVIRQTFSFEDGPMNAN